MRSPDDCEGLCRRAPKRSRVPRKISTTRPSGCPRLSRAPARQPAGTVLRRCWARCGAGSVRLSSDGDSFGASTRPSLAGPLPQLPVSPRVRQGTPVPEGLQTRCWSLTRSGGLPLFADPRAQLHNYRHRAVDGGRRIPDPRPIEEAGEVRLRRLGGWIKSRGSCWPAGKVLVVSMCAAALVYGAYSLLLGG
jgi:hypothetical protein